MEERSSLTALMSSFARAYHAETCERPVFTDHMARKLMTDAEYANIQQYIVSGIRFFAPDKHFRDEKEALDFVVNTQLAPTPLARAQYCEESLKTAVCTGTTQYVILGAGMDTFAWRESAWIKRLTIFEVDHPLTQAEKKKRLERAGLGVPDNLHFVSMDFTGDDLKTSLLENGFDETQKTFFSWLGVTYYLSAEDIAKLLDSIASFAAEGSTLLFDYPDSGLFDAKEQRVQNMLAMAKASGEPMKFCSDERELTRLLETHHFLIYEHLSPTDIQMRYFAGRDDEMTAFEHIGYVTAVLKGTPFINTKEKILQTAMKLFAQNGYEAVSIKDIADQLSLTKAALYKHYQSKRDIFDQIVARMEEQDAKRARAYEMPESPAEKDLEAYRKTQLDSVIAYTESQFRYWTEDPFACRFRRMLTLEQYRDAEMTALYQQYLCGGPLSYIQDIFLQLVGDSQRAEQAAVDFYAPVFMLYSLYDGTQDKRKPKAILHEHLCRFVKKFGKGE